MSPEAFKIFFENSKGLMCIHDLEGKILEVNAASAASLGYTLEELREMSLFDVIPESFHGELKQYLAAISAQGKMEGLMRPRHKMGRSRFWLFTNVLQKDPDGSTYVIGSALDITDRYLLEGELKRHKALLTAFVEHAPAAVAMLDKDLRFIACSNRWLDDYTLAADNVVGRSIFDVFQGLTEDMKTMYQRCLGGYVEKCDEYKRFKPGWPDQYIRWEVRSWDQYDGSVGGLMILTEDITEVRRQREELKGAKLLAEQASMAKSEFLANMSHEIRTPLNGIIGFTDLVLKTELTEVQEQYLGIVNQSAGALLNIINDILDFSKIEAGKLELDVERCDLFELTGEASDVVTFQVQRKGLEMLLNVSPELPRFIWVDMVRLKQVLINLLGNAVKFTEQGEVELKVTRQSAMIEGRVRLRFQVRDTGIGIQPEKQGTIFEAFLQEDASTTKKYGGTGLGLTISNKLLGLMGSKLELISAPGAGSTFSFDLDVPAAHGDPVVLDELKRIAQALVVDDNEHNRAIVRNMLALRGIPCDEAADGYEALRKVKAGAVYDVVIMDYYMPGINGLDTIRQLREILPRDGSAPFILLHSSAEDEQIIHASRTLEIDSRLLKPIKMGELYQALSRLYRNKQSAAPEKNGSADGLGAMAIRILLVEDNEVNIILTKTILGNILPKSGITLARNGREALDACATGLPDLILMDVQMPEMNGYEATRAIRQRYPDRRIPIIAMTAGNVKGEREKCLEAGMDDFLSKPFRQETLVSVLEKWASPAGDPHFDIHVLKENLGDAADDEAISAILQVTARELNDTAAAVREAASEKDAQRLRAIGHKLYGTAASIGMTTLSTIARAMEKTAQPDLPEVVDRLLEEIGCCLERVTKHSCPLL